MLFCDFHLTSEAENISICIHFVCKLSIKKIFSYCFFMLAICRKIIYDIIKYAIFFDFHIAKLSNEYVRNGKIEHDT